MIDWEVYDIDVDAPSCSVKRDSQCLYNKYIKETKMIRRLYKYECNVGIKLI